MQLLLIVGVVEDGGCWKKVEEGGVKVKAFGGELACITWVSTSGTGTCKRRERKVHGCRMTCALSLLGRSHPLKLLLADWDDRGRPQYQICS